MDMHAHQSDEHERDAVLNACAHALAVYERLPPKWIPVGETQIVQDILERLAPPQRHKADPVTPIALRVARRHLAELFKRTHVRALQDNVATRTHGGPFKTERAAERAIKALGSQRLKITDGGS